MLRWGMVLSMMKFAAKASRAQVAAGLWLTCKLLVPVCSCRPRAAAACPWAPGGPRLLAPHLPGGAHLEP